MKWWEWSTSKKERGGKGTVERKKVNQKREEGKKVVLGLRK